MSNAIAFFNAHQTIITLVAYYVLSAAVGSLPAPAADSGAFYRWVFQFSNTLAGNLSRAFSNKLPGGSQSASPNPQPSDAPKP